jgi:hypothetical protein
MVALQRRPPDPSDYGDVELQQPPASSCPRCRTSLHEKNADLYCPGCGRRKQTAGGEFANSGGTALPHPPRLKRLVREMSSVLPSASGRPLLPPHPYTLSPKPLTPTP